MTKRNAPKPADNPVEMTDPTQMSAPGAAPDTAKAAARAGAPGKPARQRRRDAKPDGAFTVPADPPAQPLGDQSGAGLNAPAQIGATSGRVGAYGINLVGVIRGNSRWREWYNPLRSLNFPRVVAAFENAQRGMYADLTWLYKFVEEFDATSIALQELRIGALVEMGQNFEPFLDEELPKGCSAAEAKEQCDCLRQSYARLDNWEDALAFAALATFRGFSHLEKVYNPDGSIAALSPVEQWHWCRQGIYYPWTYNASAVQTNFGEEVDLDRFIIREHRLAIDRFGLPKFLRQNLSEKNWDSILEIVGIPHAVVIGPPNVQSGLEAIYEQAGLTVAEGGTGYLPNGADVKFPTSELRANIPFRDRLQWLNEQHVLVGTGGKLKMLAESGSGNLAGGAHSDTFSTIARSEARSLARTFNRQCSADMIDLEFPGRPVLARMSLAYQDSQDPSEMIDQVQKAAAAGLKVKRAQFTERTGWELEEEPDPAANPNAAPGETQPGKEAKDSASGGDADPEEQSPGEMLDALLKNRAAASDPSTKLGRALADDLAPVRDGIARILDIADPDEQLTAAKEWLDGLPTQLKAIGVDPEAAKVLVGQMRQAFASAATEGAKS